MRKKWTEEERKIRRDQRLYELSMREVNEIVELVKNGTPLIIAQRQVRKRKKK